MTEPLVSIVMSVYNESISEIKRCIQSMYNQTYRNFDYIIVDDNPISLRIKTFLLYEKKQHHNMKIIFNNQNLGAFNSYNRGILHSDGRLIARIDADDISKSNRLLSQIKFMREHKLDLVFSNCSVMNVKGNIIDTHYFSDITQYNQNKIKKAMSYCNIANGPTFLFKISVFRKIGGYRTHFIDDYDFATRALIYGFRLGYQADDLVIKRYRKDSINHSNVLKQFCEVLVLSHFLRKTKFHHVISNERFVDAINRVDKKIFNKFNKFIKYRNEFKCHYSFIYLFKALLIALSTHIILKKILWDKFIAEHQNDLLK